MPTWSSLRVRCDALPEPFKSQCMELYVEAHTTNKVYPDNDVQILFQLEGTVLSCEWDAAHGTEASWM